jgi:hypothetical protein
MLVILKKLSNTWVVLILLFIVMSYPILLIYKNWNSPPIDHKVNGVEVDPRTHLCVSELALIDGDCTKRKDIDCETLIRSYEASCFTDDSPQTKEIEQRLSDWYRNSRN